MICSVDELIELCQYWQNELNIQFWDIKVGIYRARDFIKEKSQGEVSWTLSTATAIIRILDPMDYDNDIFPMDMEKTLVHELLHLRFAEADKTALNSMEETMYERAIDHTAKALVKLKRK